MAMLIEVIGITEVMMMVVIVVMGSIGEVMVGLMEKMGGMQEGMGVDMDSGRRDIMQRFG
jgi:hypothetical protein